MALLTDHQNLGHKPEIHQVNKIVFLSADDQISSMHTRDLTYLHVEETQN